jgi:hypothetical protein
LPDLEQSAWKLAKANTAGVYRSAAFNISTALIFLLAGTIATAASSGGESKEVATVGLLAGLAGLICCVAAVLIFQVAAAPLRQRDELRQAWRRLGRPEVPPVPVALTDFSRRADDLLRKCKAAGFTTNDEETLETWTREVVLFLSRYCNQHSAQAFALASRHSGSFFVRLEKRLAALEEIIALNPTSPLPPEPHPDSLAAADDAQNS